MEGTMNEKVIERNLPEQVVEQVDPKMIREKFLAGAKPATDARYTRQGDVLFVPIVEPLADEGNMVADPWVADPWSQAWIDIRSGWRNPETFLDGVVLGGTLGRHTHRIFDPALAICIGSNRGERDVHYVVTGDDVVDVVHEEHNTVYLLPNTIYRVHRALEYNPAVRAAHYVVD
jgi:hypothetical protein